MARRPALRTPPRVSARVAPVILDADGFRTVETAGLISFEPTSPAMLHARAGLRSLLAGLSAQPGELLHGVVEGPAVAGTDLDNALLYNIGGSVNAAARYGVALERRTGTSPTRYRYRLTRDADAPALDGTPLVELDHVPLGRPPRAWPDVWAPLRTSDRVHILASAPVGDLGLFLRLGAPRFAGGANAQFVKTVVDGVMTALHAHGDPTSADAVAERLAVNVPLPGDDIAGLLLDDDRAALGFCHRLVVLRGQGVQCQPQDGRVAALRIELDRSLSSWTLSGRLVSLDS